MKTSLVLGLREAAKGLAIKEKITFFWDFIFYLLKNFRLPLRSRGEGVRP